MGRAASHITLECALQTHPNITLIGEEVLLPVFISNTKKLLPRESLVFEIKTTFDDWSLFVHFPKSFLGLILGRTE